MNQDRLAHSNIEDAQKPKYVLTEGPLFETSKPSFL